MKSDQGNKFFGDMTGQASSYEAMLDRKRKGVSLKDVGLKCIVSDYAIAQWFTQSLKLDMHNMPVNAPAELSRKAVTQFDNRDFTSYY